MKNYYEVEVKCGHVGKGKFIAIKFPVIAESGKEAAKIGRWLPRVKHHNKECVLNVTKVSLDTYNELLKENKKNAFLKCVNVQEQNVLCPDLYTEVKELYDKKDDEDYFEKKKRENSLSKEKRV